MPNPPRNHYLLIAADQHPKLISGFLNYNYKNKSHIIILTLKATM